ncbi:HK97 gp10 family phage protein [Clostridium cellulovorans]|uniref:Phage related protein n=1 Tax=Clostridium cellulovorans (strain ATCC 35296 / DSM 3052 / OCM 3 / 743B) TaxID=573061 RepID=D9SQ10_CLOC7|nr:HK97 gp10 family phage protein [Clostridium cellulovorans]ADL52146.1 phage related protein [Clostridium cellulovorans 743B]
MDIDISRLAATITETIGSYTEEISEAIEVEVNQTTKDTLKKIRETSPSDRGKYKKGFKITKIKERGQVKNVIWNKKYSGLVHLLEFGHAKRNGGRVQAVKHVEPAFDSVAGDLEDRIKSIIQNGGR